MVPVGANTDAWELRTPYCSASSTASSHASWADESSSGGTRSSSIFDACAWCLRSTPTIGSAFSWKPANGPIRLAMRAEVA